MICKCWNCKRPKDADEADFCEQCGQNTCFDCADVIILTCCEALEKKKSKQDTRASRQKFSERRDYNDE